MSTDEPSFGGGVSALEAALARIEIDALIAEFAYRIDHDRSETVAELFTENGWYGRDSGQRSVGRAAIRAAYAARSTHGRRVARHIFTNLRLSVRSVTEADGVCILLLFAADGDGPHPAEPKLVQDYHDTYRKVGGRWLFASRETFPAFVSPAYNRVLPLGKTSP
jgi:hypothetical protein